MNSLARETYPYLKEADEINVLVVGSGGREHALAWKLSQSERIGNLAVAPGNGGTEGVGSNVAISSSDTAGLIEYAQDNDVDLVIVGPDDALAAGMVDDFGSVGIPAFGPTRQAARIESSKPYAKQLMDKHGVFTAGFQIFSSAEAAHAYVDENQRPLFAKAGGLALGKGAIACETPEAAHYAIDDILVSRQFGDAGKELVLEEWLEGDEVSLHAICDGETYKMFPSSQDHKQRYDGDKGLNTGGMGTIAPVPWYDQVRVNAVGLSVVSPVLSAMDWAETPFRGLLYPGIMVTNRGDAVIEYNARFGDPETQVYMRLMKNDLLEVIVAAMNHKLGDIKMEWHEGYAICVNAVSDGYPGNYKKGLPIRGVDDIAQNPGIEVFHSGTRREDGQLFTNGGRVLGITAAADTLAKAQDMAYESLEMLDFEGIDYRHDIGNRRHTT